MRFCKLTHKTDKLGQRMQNILMSARRFTIKEQPGFATRTLAGKCEGFVVSALFQVEEKWIL